MISEKIANALYMLDIGQSFVLANASAEGVVRDLKKLLPDVQDIRVGLEEMKNRFLEEGSIARGSLWKADDGSVHRVIGMANLNSERKEDYPPIVFHFDANRKEEVRDEVWATALEVWQKTHHLVSLSSQDFTIERMMRLLDEVESEIRTAIERGDDFIGLRAAVRHIRRPVNALQEGLRDLAALCLPDGQIATGSHWIHYNGNRYAVIGAAENGNRVVYRGENGHVWTRALSDWHRSMSSDDPIEIKRSVFGDRTFS